MADQVTLTLRMDDIALGDIEDFEEYTGKPVDILDEMGDDGKFKDGTSIPSRIYTGMALLALRQQDSDATVEDARQVKIGQLRKLETGDPTVAEPVELKPLRDKPARTARQSAS